MPVNVEKRDQLGEVAGYGNNPSVRGHEDCIAKTLVNDVITGRVLVLKENFIHEVQGIRLSPLGVAEKP